MPKSYNAKSTEPKVRMMPDQNKVMRNPKNDRQPGGRVEFK